MLRKRPGESPLGHKAMVAHGKKIAYFDSAASSNFITADSIAESDLEHLEADTLKVETAMEGEKSMVSRGRGDFSAIVQGSSGKSPLYLGNASVLPNLRESLISIGQLTQDGYELQFKGEYLTLLNATNGNVVLTQGTGRMALSVF